MMQTQLLSGEKIIFTSKKMVKEVRNKRWGLKLCSLIVMIVLGYFTYAYFKSYVGLVFSFFGLIVGAACLTGQLEDNINILGTMFITNKRIVIEYNNSTSVVFLSSVKSIYFTKKQRVKNNDIADIYIISDNQEYIFSSAPQYQKIIDTVSNQLLK